MPLVPLMLLAENICHKKIITTQQKTITAAFGNDNMKYCKNTVNYFNTNTILSEKHTVL